MKALKESVRYRLKDGYSLVHDAVIENGDGKARGRRGILAGNLSLNLLNQLVTSTYFTSLMLAMDADDVYISYISMLIIVCGFFQIFAPLILERLGRRKALLLTLRAIQHFLNIVVIGVIPLMPWPKEIMLNVFMVAVFMVYTLNAITTPGFSGWHLQSLPYAKRVNFYTIQNMSSQFLGLTLAYAAGVFLDFFENNTISFRGMTPTITALVLMRILAVLIAVSEIWFYTWIREYPYEKDADERNNRGIRLLGQPLRNKAYMTMISVQLLWNLNSTLIGPHFNVYLIDDVQMSYSFMMLGGLISLPITLIVTPIWGKLLHRKNWVNILGIGMAGFSLAYFLNMLITSSTQYMYVLSLIACYMFSPCVNIAILQLNYLKLPPQNTTSYLSLCAILVQAVTLLGTFLGTQFIMWTDGVVLNVFGFEMVNKQYINIIQFTGLWGLIFYVLHINRKLSKEQDND